MKKMLTKIAIISALSLTLFISSTYFNIENIGNGEWEKFYENGSFYGIIAYNDSYMVVGYKWCNNNTQGWLVKIDAEGNIIWEKTYGGKEDDEFRKIIREDENFIIAGETSSYGNDGRDFWVVKVDENGNEIWNKTYGNNENMFLRSIIKDDNGYLLCGSGLMPGEYLISYLVKIDKNGDAVWIKYYRDLDFFDVTKTNDGYAVVGEKHDMVNMTDIVLLKIDEQGNEIWNKTYGGKNTDGSSCIIDTGDGFLIGGVFGISLTQWRALLIKTNYEGNVEWMKTYGKLREELFKVIETRDGYLFVGGTESVGHGNAWMVEVDKNGEEIWNKSFGGRHSYAIMDIIEENGYYIGCGNKVEEKPTIKINAWILKCGDYPPPSIKIVKPKEDFLYLFDREILPLQQTLIIGGITVKAELNDSLNKVDRVEYYITGPDFYDYEPHAIDYSPPYEWKWNEKAMGQYEITVAAYYGNAGAVAVDKIELYIINPFPPASSASLHK